MTFNIRKVEYIILIMFGMLFFTKYGGEFFRFIPVSGYGLMIIVLSAIVALKTKEKIYFYKSYIMLFIIFTFLLASLLWTRAPMYGSSKIIFLFFDFILFYFIAPIIYRNFKFFLLIQVLFYLFYLFNLYIEYGTIYNIFSELNLRFRLGWDESDTTLFHPIGISRYITLGIINILFFIGIFLNNKRKIIIVLLFSLILYGIVFLFFSGTRTPILAAVVAFLLYFLINKKTSNKVKFSIILFPIVSLLMVYSLLRVDFALTEDQKDFIEYRFNNPDAAVDDRGWQLKRAMSKLDGTHLLQGRGAGDFAYEFYHEDIREYPHNIFTELLFENGILMVILFLLIIISVIKINRTSDSAIVAYFIVMFYYTLVNGSFSGDLGSNSIVFGYFIILLAVNKYAKKGT